MTTLSQDTSHEAERVQIDLFRQAAPSHKMQMVAEMNRALRVLALSGLRETSLPALTVVKSAR